MSKKSFKFQASSSRASSGYALSGFGGYGTSPSSTASASFGGASSVLSYLAESPDLGAISNANVAVNFKNLTKRDNVTKSRALEELQAHVSSEIADHIEIEDALIDAWVGESTTVSRTAKLLFTCAYWRSMIIADPSRLLI